MNTSDYPTFSQGSFMTIYKPIKGNERVNTDYLTYFTKFKGKIKA